VNIIIGVVITLLGVLGLAGWWNDFITILKGSLPVILIFSGIIAVIAGASELQEKLGAKKEEKK
jgi:hypothetical protein